MSRLSKRPRLLQASEISELIVDTDSDEAGVSSDASLVEGGTESVPGLSQPQPYHQTVSSHESSSSISPVPLMKRMPARVGQLNRFNRQ